MASPRRPERNRAARSFRQLRRFHHVINSYKVFGTDKAPWKASLPCFAACGSQNSWKLKASYQLPKNRIVPAWPILSAYCRTKIKATHQASNNGVDPHHRNFSHSSADSIASSVNVDVVTT